MSSREEWGPWIEHDGMGCPVPVGSIVQAVGVYRTSGLIAKKGEEVTKVAVLRSSLGTSWTWSKHQKGSVDYGIVIRYRIRKPRGLTMLQEIASSVTEPTDGQQVTA